MGSIWDESRLHAARSYTSSPYSPFSLSDRLSHSPPTSSSVFLSWIIVGSMWDDSRLHAARSYTSSPDSPFSLRSSFTQSAHLFFIYIPLLCGVDTRYGTIVASMQLGRTPDSPFSLRSSFTQSAHLFFGLPLLLPCTSMPITLFPAYSSLLITCPYHRILCSWTFFEISPTFVLPLIFSFLILSNLVTPHVHRNVFSFLRPPSSSHASSSPKM